MSSEEKNKWLVFKSYRVRAHFRPHFENRLQNDICFDQNVNKVVACVFFFQLNLAAHVLMMYTHTVRIAENDVNRETLRWTVHDGSLFLFRFQLLFFFLFGQIFNSFVFLIETIRYWTFFPMQGQWSKVRYAHLNTSDGVGWFEAYQQRLSPAMITKSCFRRLIVVFVLIIEFGSPFFLDILLISSESISISKHTHKIEFSFTTISDCHWLYDTVCSILHTITSHARYLSTNAHTICLQFQFSNSMHFLFVDKTPKNGFW